MKSLTPRLEDVIMALWDLEQLQSGVRVKDLERYFSIRTSSVIDFIRSLKKRKLVHHEKYGTIDLTLEGRKQARLILSRRLLLRRFFSEVLFLQPDIAHQEACSFEHHIHPDTQLAMNHLLSFFTAPSSTAPPIASRFRQYICSQEETAARTRPLSEIPECGAYQVDHLKAPADAQGDLQGLGLSPGTLLELLEPADQNGCLHLRLQGLEATISLSSCQATWVWVQPAPQGSLS